MKFIHVRRCGRTPTWGPKIGANNVAYWLQLSDFLGEIFEEIQQDGGTLRYAHLLSYSNVSRAPDTGG